MQKLLLKILNYILESKNRENMLEEIIFNIVENKHYYGVSINAYLKSTHNRQHQKINHKDTFYFQHKHMMLKKIH